MKNNVTISMWAISDDLSLSLFPCIFFCACVQLPESVEHVVSSQVQAGRNSSVDCNFKDFQHHIVFFKNVPFNIDIIICKSCSKVFISFTLALKSKKSLFEELFCLLQLLLQVTQIWGHFLIEQIHQPCLCLCICFVTQRLYLLFQIERGF